ncbi:MAG TPA: universal stress protein [Pirellulales bacterium]|nr:universal stress protein [Pirellulales bacterium]
MIRRILVALGGGMSSATIQQAVELAKIHGAELTAAALLDAPRLSAVGPVPIGAAASAVELRQYRLQTAEQSLEEAVVQFEAMAAAAGLTYRVARERGDPIDRLVALSRYHDVVVAGLHGLFEWGLTDEPPCELVKLVSEGVRPILAVTDQPRSIQRVLIAYSGSVESAKTMKQFIRFRPWPDVRIKLLTFNEDLAAGRELLADASQYCRAHGYEPEVEASPFPPKPHLLRYAEEWNADLVVLGNSAKNLLLRRLFGETALHVIRRAEVPLFLSQ